MTALDQAFIKAYQQQAGAARPAQASRKLTLREAMQAGRSDEPTAPAAEPKKADAAPPAVAVAAEKPVVPRPHFNFNLQSTPSAGVALSALESTAGSAARPAFVRMRPAAEPPAPLRVEPPRAQPPITPPTPDEEPLVEAEIIETADVDAAEPDTAAPDVLSLVRPARQADRLLWPTACVRLLTEAGPQIDRLAEALLQAARQGTSVVAFAGSGRGVGTTTVLLSTARRLADRGVRVAVVDADWDRPQIRQRLGLLAAAGWEEVLAERSTLSEVMLAAHGKPLHLLPLCAAAERPANWREAARRTLATLKQNYDLVLVDHGPLAAETALAGPDSGIDAVVLVESARRTGDGATSAAQQPALAGVKTLGIVRNFVSE